jgi:hypothetical protein
MRAWKTEKKSKLEELVSRGRQDKTDKVGNKPYVIVMYLCMASAPSHIDFMVIRVTVTVLAGAARYYSIPSCSKQRRCHGDHRLFLFFAPQRAWTEGRDACPLLYRLYFDRDETGNLAFSAVSVNAPIPPGRLDSNTYENWLSTILAVFSTSSASFFWFCSSSRFDVSWKGTRSSMFPLNRYSS